MQILIEFNGLFSADKVQVTIEDDESFSYSIHDMNPFMLLELLENLGHNVELDDEVQFDHDDGGYSNEGEAEPDPEGL